MADTAPIETVTPKPKLKRSTAPQREYLCGYSIMQWLDDQIASHDPPLKEGAELGNYHYKLMYNIRREVYPYGDYFPATLGDSHELHPVIAFASNKPGRLPKVPRQDMVEKLQRILGTSEPPKWFVRY